MNEKMMTLAFFEFYKVYINNQDDSFSTLVNLFKERCISSVKSYKHLNNLIR